MIPSIKLSLTFFVYVFIVYVVNCILPPPPPSCIFLLQSSSLLRGKSCSTFAYFPAETSNIWVDSVIEWSLILPRRKQKEGLWKWVPSLINRFVCCLIHSELSDSFTVLFNEVWIGTIFSALHLLSSFYIVNLMIE